MTDLKLMTLKLIYLYWLKIGTYRLPSYVPINKRPQRISLANSNVSSLNGIFKGFLINVMEFTESIVPAGKTTKLPIVTNKKLRNTSKFFSLAKFFLSLN